ncbi:50S ribosomal protein L6 [Petrotoga mexicana DSM 14811]|jgi:large subunit ribosomal protein L6|uniref:Large ribosomal subunit protein uL6 n=1 Tax=Petrotoga mexicana DSM 14811 TaxID=1122954 RepID=A0A2K1PDP1_9BACT|nr:50S ribosomal protein L6 [Petrotoga mexicana]PNS00921.1 50S ribosomal protein L6 [Petrotoga mexicana DSM 14811]
MPQSRIADKPTIIPDGVELSVDGQTIKIKGKNGELSLNLPEYLEINRDNNELMIKSKEGVVKRSSDEKRLKALRGTFTSHVRNMIKGVTEGYQKELEITGIGYRAQLQGKNLVLNIGYSKPVEFPVPEGITIEVPQPTRVVVKGIDKYKVGEVAARIRSLRKVNVYSGKGIKYVGESVLRKEGKKV